MPRLLESCGNCTQLRSQIQLADWHFMEDYIVLGFYNLIVEPFKLPIHVTQRVFALEYVRQIESADVLFHGQQKKSHVFSFPFSCGGFTFERTKFQVAHDFLTMFNFDVDAY